MLLTSHGQRCCLVVGAIVGVLGARDACVRRAEHCVRGGRVITSLCGELCWWSHLSRGARVGPCDGAHANSPFGASLGVVLPRAGVPHDPLGVRLLAVASRDVSLLHRSGGCARRGLSVSAEYLVDRLACGRVGPLHVAVGATCRIRRFERRSFRLLPWQLEVRRGPRLRRSGCLRIAQKSVCLVPTSGGTLRRQHPFCAVLAVWAGRGGFRARSPSGCVRAPVPSPCPFCARSVAASGLLLLCGPWQHRDAPSSDPSRVRSPPTLAVSGCAWDPSFERAAHAFTLWLLARSRASCPAAARRRGLRVWGLARLSRGCLASRHRSGRGVRTPSMLPRAVLRAVCIPRAPSRCVARVRGHGAWWGRAQAGAAYRGSRRTSASASRIEVLLASVQDAVVLSADVSAGMLSFACFDGGPP